MILLSPFAPHLAEELWEKMEFKRLCSQQKWPEYNQALIKEEKVLLIVQINGKVREKIASVFGVSQKEVEDMVMSNEKIKQLIGGKKVKKIIFVPNKLINIVT